jgi:hypothetical protein
VFLLKECLFLLLLISLPTPSGNFWIHPHIFISFAYVYDIRRYTILGGYPLQSSNEANISTAPRNSCVVWHLSLKVLLSLCTAAALINAAHLNGLSKKLKMSYSFSGEWVLRVRWWRFKSWSSGLRRHAIRRTMLLRLPRNIDILSHNYTVLQNLQ